MGGGMIAPVADHLVLIEGIDYVLDDGDAPILTDFGFRAMVDAHAEGREVVIQIGEVVVFRLPAMSVELLWKR